MTSEPLNLEADRAEAGMAVDDYADTHGVSQDVRDAFAILTPAARNDERPGMVVAALVFSLGFTIGVVTSILAGLVVWWA